MLEEFYNLTKDPFRLGPDPEFCFEHASYNRAKAYLRYALDRSEGFALITGVPGTGKSTLIDDLLRELSGGKIVVAKVVNTLLTPEDLLLMLAYDYELEISSGASKAEILLALITFFKRLRTEDKRAIAVIDEAQGLSPAALEELRLLTNQAIDGVPLLQVLLIGQEELRATVNTRGMEQLQQRVVANCQIKTLSRDETEDYVKHRLLVAGWQNDPKLSSGVYDELFAFSTGIPRRINIMSGRLFLYGCMSELHELDHEDASMVADELRDELQMPAGHSVSQPEPGPVHYPKAKDDDVSDAAIEAFLDDSTRRFEQHPVVIEDDVSAKPEVVLTEAVEVIRPAVEIPAEPTTESVLPKGPVNEVVSISRAVKTPEAIEPAEQAAPELKEQRSSGVFSKVAAVIIGAASIATATEYGGMNVDSLKDSLNRGWGYVDTYISQYYDVGGKDQSTSYVQVEPEVMHTVSPTPIEWENAEYTPSSEPEKSNIVKAGLTVSSSVPASDVGVNVMPAPQVEQTKPAVTMAAVKAEPEMVTLAMPELVQFPEVVIDDRSEVVEVVTNENASLVVERDSSNVVSENTADDSSLLDVVEMKAKEIISSLLPSDSSESIETPDVSSVDVVKVNVPEETSGLVKTAYTLPPKAVLVKRRIKTVPVNTPDQTYWVDGAVVSDDEKRAVIGLTKYSVDREQSVKIWRVPFYFDSVNPSKDIEADLSEVIALSDQNQAQKIYVVGYADKSGQQAYNLSLSQRRAKNIARLFKNRGVSNNRMVVQGLGSVERAFLHEEEQSGRMVEIYLIDD